MTKKVSKPTLFRDLKALVELGLVRSSGVGKATIYNKIVQNPLLAHAKKLSTKEPILFNFEIFDHLSNLFTPKEMPIHKNLSEQLERLDKTIAKKELERFVIELAWKSSQIEGNTYTLLETEALIKTQQEAIGHTKEEATMILNHKSAFDLIIENREKFKILNLSDITQLHNILIDNMDVTPGIRKHPVGITGSIYRPLDNEWQIREALEKMITAVNKSGYPLEKALIIMSVLAYIQPFADGNKRTSRMLANALLVAYDYYPISYRAVDEIEYKKAIINFYEQNSLYELKKILIIQYKFALDNYFRN
ncbi:MAG: Fic family protein [Candidatus Amesbacteria bacterium]|nr:Fic family protein [Candidatus Amesbacteria bacterium]